MNRLTDLADRLVDLDLRVLGAPPVDTRRHPLRDDLLLFAGIVAVMTGVVGVFMGKWYLVLYVCVAAALGVVIAAMGRQRHRDH
ncbi:MAG: hypothetical protein JO246_02815 [Frankiaceae bacterium]|nr:hypothetical protein [Frankiaceae bacterium]MBV9870677.1 hypothetical protein [Frankiaceae bacterium]